MYSHYIQFVLLWLFCLSFTYQLCKCQETTICSSSDGKQINLVGDNVVRYIDSFNYPEDYASIENGDCRILITSTESKIKITIINYIRRTPSNEYTLRFYDGTSDHGSVRRDSFSLFTNKTFTSGGRSLYITHWSIGESNNAFRISYQSYTEPRTEEESGEEDQGWIPGVVVGVMVFLYCMCHCHRQKRATPQPQQAPAQPQAQAPPTPAPQTEITMSEVQIESAGRGNEATNSTGDSNTIIVSAPVPDLISNNDVNYRSPPPPYHLAVLYSEEAREEDNSETKK